MLLASATWNKKALFFKCDLQIPSGLQTAKNFGYSLTALQKVGGSFVAVPPYTNTAADANPETIFLR